MPAADRPVPATTCPHPRGPTTATNAVSTRRAHSRATELLPAVEQRGIARLVAGQTLVRAGDRIPPGGRSAVPAYPGQIPTPDATSSRAAASAWLAGPACSAAATTRRADRSSISRRRAVRPRRAGRRAARTISSSTAASTGPATRATICAMSAPAQRRQHPLLVRRGQQRPAQPGGRPRRVVRRRRTARRRRAGHRRAGLPTGRRGHRGRPGRAPPARSAPGRRRHAAGPRTRRPAWYARCRRGRR